MLSLRHLDKGVHVFNQFLDLVPFANGKSDNVVTAIVNVILKISQKRNSMDSVLIGQRF